jgi:hypothetical protein
VVPPGSNSKSFPACDPVTTRKPKQGREITSRVVQLSYYIPDILIKHFQHQKGAIISFSIPRILRDTTRLPPRNHNYIAVWEIVDFWSNAK